MDMSTFCTCLFGIQHRRLVHNYWFFRRSVPKVAVLVPAAGEDIKLVTATLQAASKISYPNFEVYLLDDTRSGMYKEVAAASNAFYIQRPNIGQNKKSGNVNHALTLLKDVEYILILDADFVPRREILRELVPYAGQDVGIIQSPQHFSLSDDIYDRSKIEFGAGLIQKDFYRITQVTRNKYGSAICVGTNALYSVQALQDVGGFEGVGGGDPWTHSEDVNTGLKMLNYTGRPYNYRIEYVPVQLAEGVCPDTYFSLYKQQARWATGSVRLMFSEKTLFSKTLKPIQKLFYFSNALYYLYTIAILLMPLQFLALVLFGTQFSWFYTAFFIPQLVFTFILSPYVLRKEPEPLIGMITITATAYTFLQAVYLALRGTPLGWEATGSNSKLSGSKKNFIQYKVFVLMYFMVAYVATAVVAFQRGFFELNSSTILQVLFLYSFAGQLVHLFYLYGYAGAGDLKPLRAPGRIVKKLKELEIA